MEIIINTQEKETMATLSGRLDTLAAQEVAAQFETLQEKADGTVVLDCSQLDYISSSGLRLFLTLRKAAATKGGKVIVRDLNADVRNVFMITGFLNLFEIQQINNQTI